MTQAVQYGTYMWCIRVADDLVTPDTTPEIDICGDTIEITHSGALVVKGKYRDLDEDGVPMPPSADEHYKILLSLAPNQWKFVYHASSIDSHPLAVAHWKGQII